jgi:hypothetical protein
MPEEDAVQQEREMREHEEEARKRDPNERSPEATGDLLGDQGAGAGKDDPDDAAPPGNAGRLNTSGG